ncbi:MAG: aldolase/citrate lyase family protein [Caldilineaceae bacterium]|nr:aldolase/citrate lyase family protein [Caldilineaceae bacterium]
MPRINRAIELLEAEQPIYYSGVRGSLNYRSGTVHRDTWADYLIVEFEHGAFDPVGLGEFMRGLVDAGPTRSGHRTPAVICTLPTDGTDENVMRANAWMVKQVLARGVHGILLCHVESPAAVKVFVESARYPFQTIGVSDSANGANESGKGETALGQGRRGAGGQSMAATIWGLTPQEYVHRADVWPLNPDGELLLGLKIENRRALANAEASTSVPGIAFAEWGPGDMGMSLGHADAHDPPYPPDMAAARARVKGACDAAGIFFLNSVRPHDVRELIDEGVMIGSATEEAARVGRKYTKRTMPW